MIPTSYRPTQRQRDHRRLVRQRDFIQRRITSVKNRMRCIMTDYNADVRELFSQAGSIAIEKTELSPADRFAMKQMQAEFKFLKGQLKEANAELKSFAQKAVIREREQRELLQTIPGVGFVTSEVVLAEIADIDRFNSQKQVVAYAGLAPGQRESAGRTKEQHIEKNGSKHLRWILIEAAWRLVGKSPRWNDIYQLLKKRLRAKKAIVAIARRLLCLMVAILKTGEPYSATHATGRLEAGRSSKSSEEDRRNFGSSSANGSCPVTLGQRLDRVITLVGHDLVDPTLGSRSV